MKLLILALSVLILSCITTEASTSCYTMVWRNDYLIFEVGTAIEEVKDRPTVNLYCGTQPVHDGRIYYEQGINFTTLSTVNTNRIGVYTVVYRATSPVYHVSSTKEITFHVVDTTPPEILYVPTFTIPHGKTVDFTSGLVVVDNYNRSEDLIIEVDKRNINFDRLGIYDIRYTVTDQSGNAAVATSTVKIIDDIPPAITVHAPIKINYGDINHDFLQNLTVEDNIDDNLLDQVVVDISEVDFYNFGFYDVIFDVSDSSGNQTIRIEQVEVLDLEKPVLELSENYVRIDPDVYLTDEELRNYIIMVSDNHTPLTKDDVVIHSEGLNILKVGIVEVWFEVSDESGNRSAAVLRVERRDLISPDIRAYHRTIILHESFDPLEGVIAEDNFDGDLTHAIEIIENTVDIHQVGTYYVSYLVQDRSGNYTVKTVFIDVVLPDSETDELKMNMTPRYIQIISYIGIGGTLIGIAVKKYLFK